jgi:hypothetical protein
MNIFDIANKIDVGLTLCQISGEIQRHRVYFYEEKNCIKIECVLKDSLKKINISLTIPSTEQGKGCFYV